MMDEGNLITSLAVDLISKVPFVLLKNDARNTRLLTYKN